MFEKLKERYDQGRISIAMLRVYVRKGQITKQEFCTITGEEY